MGDLQHGGAIIVLDASVGDQKPAVRKRLQLGVHRLKINETDPPPSRSTVFVHGDQPQQGPEHLLAPVPAGLHCLDQSEISLALERAANSAKLVISRKRQLATVPNTVGQLRQGVSQQRQRLTPLGVSDQPRDKVWINLDTGQSGRFLDHQWQRLRGQRSQRECTGSQPSQLWARQHRLEKLRAQCRDHLHWAAQRRTKQFREPGPFRWRSLGKQFLELIHHHQHHASARTRPALGKQQLLGHPTQPVGIEPATDLGNRPPQTRRCGRQLPGQLRDRVRTWQYRRQSQPPGLARHPWQHTGPD
jgi:hypothetical protein